MRRPPLPFVLAVALLGALAILRRRPTTDTTPRVEETWEPLTERS